MDQQKFKSHIRQQKRVAVAGANIDKVIIYLFISFLWAYNGYKGKGDIVNYCVVNNCTVWRNDKVFKNY